MKKQRKQKKIIKDRDSEDWCFECKDGGKLMICDYRDCLKVYHPECVGKDDSFMENEEPWNCNRHSCLICQNTAKFYCVCCPNAVCGCCIGEVEFAPVKGKKGFCDNCLELLLLAEQNADYDSDGEKVDFNDRETYECLFKEYWDIIKGREGLTVDNVYSADAQLKKRGRCSDSVRIGKAKECKKLKISEKALGKKKVSKAIEFIGWGSSPLIKFLTSIGKDTTKQLSQYDVESIISGYIQEKNLFHPKKKRRILCDPMLYSLFRRKSVDKNQIYSLLDIHFVANLEQSEDDESEDEDEIILGEKKNENITAAFKKQKTLSSNRTCQEEEVNRTVKESGFASMVAENFKLVYLRKSLVERLLKQPESFDCKVVGSFVRTKTDPTDYQRRTSHQLLQVRGIKKNASEVLLQVSNMPIDLNIAMLSDCDFTKEECEDLQQMVENGLLKKPTVVELEQKARSLHEDITKHWIEMELVKLQKCIDRANEKGWRAEYPFMELKY
ncbi:uncharacterized protein At5g08430-like isoform X3 [Quercus robur]|uniref:uncharacterized protein At5g08430-like isoform X3 n=1 Tax=Quercus robur TaxID=38942 RepID=UPI00216236FF|nr:uncharacterized protein At5g08430-like isoform X3 [Quercus robur]